MRRAPWVALSAFLALGCGDDGDGQSADMTAARLDGGALDGSAVDDGSTDLGGGDLGPELPAGLCPVEVTYRTTASTPTVHVAGTFNDFDPLADELVDDGAGTYRSTLLLAPGVYPYKLVVQGDGEEPWRLDPANGYRAWHEGVDNSGLRVADCFRPQLEVLYAEATAAAGITVGARYVQGRAGDLQEVRAELRRGRVRTALEVSYVLDESPPVAVVAAGGLAAGKYTVALTPVDREGAEGEPLLVLLWVEASPFDWKDALLYLSMPDRFRNGDPANDAAAGDASPGADFEGGDLNGLTEAVREGYFDQLGVNAIWVTPWVDNPAGSYLAADGVHRVTGYHGYWPTSPLGVDPRFGGPEALHELVEAAHERGIRILMDLVVNHVHEDHPYVSEHPDWLSDGCVCGTADCDWTERRLDCLFRPYMPDIDWTQLAAQERFLDDAEAWLATYDLDGFRVDAVKHVPDSAVQNLRVRIRDRFETGNAYYFMVGETAMGWDSGAGPTEGGNPTNYGTIARYVGPDALDGQLDFVLYYAAALQFLRDDPGRGMLHIDYWTRASLEQYPADAPMTPFLGSHDTPRWISLQSDPARATNQWSDLPAGPTTQEPYDRMYVAFGWLYALPGVPLLYQGDEYGQAGGADPDDRRMTRFGAELSARERSQLERVAALGRARAELPGLRSRVYRPLLVTEDVWVVARGRDADLAIVAQPLGVPHRTSRGAGARRGRCRWHRLDRCAGRYSRHRGPGRHRAQPPRALGRLLRPLSAGGLSRPACPRSRAARRADRTRSLRCRRRRPGRPGRRTSIPGPGAGPARPACRARPSPRSEPGPSGPRSCRPPPRGPGPRPRRPRRERTDRPCEPPAEPGR